MTTMQKIASALLLLLAACGDNVGDGAIDDTPGEGGVEVRAAGPTVRVRVGDAEELAVSIERTGEFVGPVTVSLADLPDGVTAAPVELGPEDTDAALLVEAADGADQGIFDVRLEAVADEDAAIADAAGLRATIAGLPGSIDPSLGDDGITLLDPAPGLDGSVRDAIIDAQGRIVVIGYTQNEDITLDGWITRFSPDGAHEEDFGEGGYLTDFGADESQGRRLLPAGDGFHALVYRYADIDEDGKQDTVIRRYLGDGSLDEGYGEDGEVITAVLYPERDVALRGDGVVVHNSIDIEAFDGDGEPVEFTEIKAYADVSRADDDGRTVVAMSDGVDGPWMLGRVTADGGLDEDFGDDGYQTYPQPVGHEQAYINDLVLAADGSGFAAASSQYDQDDFLAQGAVLAFAADGAPVAGFGDGGHLVVEETDGYAMRVLLDGHGGLIVLVVRDLGGDERDTVVRRYAAADGALDETFGDGGELLLEHDSYVMRIDADGRLVVVGGLYDGTIAIQRIWL
ncbi:MAG TPA: hypothetical protein VMZ28_09560 [Kofleriaceae bacterium]|nr:hypothetical protein [Kofleriaceae bacterium]